MPYIYAIEERVYNDGNPPVNGVFKRNIHQFGPDSTEYVPVPKEVAETHPDGRWKLVSIHGKAATGWVKFKHKEEAAIQYGKGKPLTDATGQPLQYRDFVMTTIDKYANLRLCEVVSFTPQKIRIRDLTHGYNTMLKFPEDLVKVDKDLYV